MIDLYLIKRNGHKLFNRDIVFKKRDCLILHSNNLLN